MNTRCIGSPATEPPACPACSKLNLAIEQLEAKFGRAQKEGSLATLGAAELVEMLKQCGMVSDDSAHPGKLRLDHSAGLCDRATQARVSGLLEFLDTEPLHSLNALLDRFDELRKHLSNGEPAQRESVDAETLLRAEQERIELIRKETHETAGETRKRLRDLLDGAQNWAVQMQLIGDELTRRSAEMETWQIVVAFMSSARIEELSTPNVVSLGRNRIIARLRKFNEHLAGMHPAAEGFDGEDASAEQSVAGIPALHAPVTQLIDQRMEPLATTVEQFHKLAATEAAACRDRMFAALGENKLASVSVSGGLIGALAYATSLRDLDKHGLATAGLISTADVTDFASRLFIPFLLLMVMVLCLICAGVAALQADQRRTREYMSRVAIPLIFLSLTGTLLYLWTRPTSASMVAISVMSGVIALVIGIIVLLGWVGTRPGVKTGDRLQMLIVRCLKACSAPQGLFAVLAIISLLLFSSQDIAVIFAKPIDSSQRDLVSAADPQAWSVRRSYVLESKDAYKPIRIGPHYSRLNKVWIVERWPTTVIDPNAIIPPNKRDWLVIAEGSVACVRELSDEEKLPAAPLGKLCTGVKEETVGPIDKPPVTTRTYPTNSIAAYSMGKWLCSADSFENQPVATMRFANAKWHGSHIEQLSSAAIKTPGLGGFPPGSGDVFKPELLADSMLAGEDNIVVVLGFANTVGSPTFNLWLSKERAKTLKRELQSQLGMLLGLPPGGQPHEWQQRIYVAALGETELSGVFGEQDNDMERRAVAFVCRGGARQRATDTVS